MLTRRGKIGKSNINIKNLFIKRHPGRAGGHTRVWEMTVTNTYIEEQNNLLGAIVARLKIEPKHKRKEVQRKRFWAILESGSEVKFKDSLVI